MTPRMTVQDVFEFLNPKQLDIISEHSQKIRLEAGDIVYKMGDPADHLYTVLEGHVALRLPGKGGTSVLIDQLTKGATFGSCVSFQGGTYALTAQCTEKTQLLMTRAAVLKSLMDDDLVMGYAIQSRISEIYFNRYLETMNKLQAIVMNLPIESV
jgi:CRP/FNR family cyclic AMP-dependent transcriptional regulator